MSRRYIDVDKQLVRLLKLNLGCADVIREFLLTAEPEAEPEYDLDGYSSRLWKAAYERGKRDAESKIVHCKDCKHRNGSACDYSAVWVRKNGFCQWGERKHDEDPSHPFADSVMMGD